MKTILVIEDETQTRKVLLNCLKFEGFKAFEADNGRAGLDIAQKHHPDLIVCDIMMSEMDGYEVLSALRQQLSTIAIPIIFLTAKVTMFDRRFGMNLGAEDYLTKPCSVDRLISAIKTRLKRTEELQRWHNSRFNAADSSFFESHNLPECIKITKVFEFIEENYHRPLELKEVASTLGYSPAYLTHLVRQKTGRTIKQWIIERRMDKARKLLLNSDRSVTQIARKTGYLDTGYFIRQFKSLHGTTPNLWRNNPKQKEIA
ncbi:response regulator [Myxosarcina sp. GI1]|uniref:response regulator transcription factor n=1 Tax=Myxosarcina sp. GI1 TaxID=1541065 RepID=UPI00055FBC2A|nr:response regulator [Myxosarcina sp. GI1]